MLTSPESILVVDYCSPIVQSSGAIGSAEQWDKAFRAVSKIVVPITLIINCDFPQNYVPPAAMQYQSDIKVRWADQKGGGEAILDASSGMVVTVGGNWVEVEVNHKSFCAAGALPGAPLIVSVTGFAGTVPHPRPVRSQRFALGAGAFSARLKIPRYTYLSRLESVPEVTSQLFLRGYQDQLGGSGAIQECSGRNALVNMSGADYIDVENAGPVARTVVLVVHELTL